MKVPESTIEADYIKRINQVFAYIQTHLSEELSLQKLAQIAHFSPFHFHRIFKTIVGETLKDYIGRQRLEGAAIELMYREEVNIGALSHDYGFSSNAVFTRAFNRLFGMSPSAYRSKHFIDSKKGKRLSKESKAVPDYQKYVRSINHLKHWRDMNGNIEVKQMPQMDVAYITCMGVDGMEQSFERLMQWARPKGLLDSENVKMATIYYDSFKTTEPSKVRMNACLVLEEPVEVAGEIGKTQINAEKCIVGRFELGVNEFEKAWTGMFLWMKEQGYSISESNPYEVYYNDYHEHPEKKFILDLCIPVN